MEDQLYEVVGLQAAVPSKVRVTLREIRDDSGEEPVYGGQVTVTAPSGQEPSLFDRVVATFAVQA